MTENDVLSRKQCGHLIAKVAMDKRAELSRIDKEIGVALAMPAADTTRRLAELYRIAEPKEPFVIALIGRLVATVHGGNP
ncbi:hypothetical protein [Paraburkholderia sp. XV]|uniref:hypothetical protein n=1 Tax=Paraburkholderia sp. XV TaxID=2831520 RepID=UPI001CD759F0|nr:hypothetical protein [Paraburkholderia sp. XV]